MSLWNFEVWEIHPMLVHFPIALLLTAVAADIAARAKGNRALARSAAGLLVAGVVTGWLAAAAGVLAYFTVPAHTEAAHTWMYWHLGIAAGMLLLFTGLAVSRWRHRDEEATGRAVALGLVASALLLAAGYLGGSIVYRGGAGVAPELLAEEPRQGHSH